MFDAFADQGFEPVNDLREFHAGRVDDQGVLGRLHRRDRPRGVAFVAFAEVARNLLQGDRFAARNVFGVPALAQFVGGRGQEELFEGVGEDDGPLIAPFGNDVVFAGEVALQGDQTGANLGAVGQESRRLSNLDAANDRRDVLAVEQNPTRRQTDGDAATKAPSRDRR